MSTVIAVFLIGEGRQRANVDHPNSTRQTGGEVKCSALQCGHEPFGSNQRPLPSHRETCRVKPV